MFNEALARMQTYLKKKHKILKHVRKTNILRLKNSSLQFDKDQTDSLKILTTHEDITSKGALEDDDDQDSSSIAGEVSEESLIDDGARSFLEQFKHHSKLIEMPKEDAAEE